MNPDMGLPAGLGDLVLDKPYYAEIEGRVEVELRNADSGKLEHRDGGSNFLGRINDDYLAWAQRERYFRYCPNRGTSMYSRRPADGMQDHLACWTDNREEDGPNERYFRGLVTAYSNRGTYSGSDSKRGTLNFVESYVNNTECRWVFDWPTTSGNTSDGFWSVGWTRLFEWNGDAMQNGAFTSMTIPGTNVPSANGIGGIAHNGSHWCMINANFSDNVGGGSAPEKAIYKMNANGSYSTKVSYSHDLTQVSTGEWASHNGLAWDGQNFWSGEAYGNHPTYAAGRLWMLPANGGAGTLYRVNNCGPITGVAYDGAPAGGRLYILDGHNNKIFVVQVSPAEGRPGIQLEITPGSDTLAILNTIGVTGPSQTNSYRVCSYGMAFEPGNYTWFMNAGTNANNPGNLVRFDGNMGISARCTNGSIFTQTQAGLAYGVTGETITTRFGATCEAWNNDYTLPSEPNYTSGHSTADSNVNAAQSSVTPTGPLTWHNGKLHALASDNSIRVVEPWGIGTRIKLGNKITKTSVQTMKIRYNFGWA